MKHFVLMIGCLLCAFIYGCDLNDDHTSPSLESQGWISVLIVDEASNIFLGGKIYDYADSFSSYNLEVENVEAADAGYVKLFFQENSNEIIYYASQIFMGNGQIIIPNPLTPANQFDHVLTTDYVFFPESAIELTNLGAGNVENLWGSIQGLQLVRTALQSPNSQIHYFRQSLDGGFTDDAKWIFIIKY